MTQPRVKINPENIELVNSLYPNDDKTLVSRINKILTSALRKEAERQKKSR
ncbi:hypothetical protein ACFSJY_19165 [Thalassotalea euphylliae]|uniref:hypothetical protein n=1 Tax=Thalassotalea euphylliae TaxID=1655234 RepID=UPI003627CDC1